MYACSPKWKGDWIRLDNLSEILTQLSRRIGKRYPFGTRVGINYGLHFTGGEPFLNFELLLMAVEMTKELDIPATFVETNCFWCVDDEVTGSRLKQLSDAGLDGILVSVNPFILEHVPFERTMRAIRISKEVFEDNLLIYQEFFHDQFKRLNVRTTMTFEDYLQKAGLECLSHVELIPMGRASYQLANLFTKHPASEYFGESCREELTRPWHVHVDNYCNYITGYCGGITLGDARKLDLICREGVDLSQYPIIRALVSDVEELFNLACREFEYEELPRGYISKCHLCLDIRQHLVRKTNRFRELEPKEFYSHLK